MFRICMIFDSGMKATSQNNALPGAAELTSFFVVE